MNTVDVTTDGCPRCGETLSVGGGDCVVCGWPQDGAARLHRVDPPPHFLELTPPRDLNAVYPLALVFGGLAFFNFLMPVTLRAMAEARTQSAGLIAFVVSLYAGVLMAQICLAALWGALGRERVLSRVLHSGLVLTILWFAVVLGMATMELPDFSDALGVFLAAPLVFVGAQAPLWLVRTLLHWRIDFDDQPQAKADAQEDQLRIGDLFVGTAAVAAALAVARFGFFISERPDAGNPMEWLVVLLAVVAAAACSVLAAWPCAWAALLARNTAAACLIVGGCAFGLAMLICMGLVGIVHAPADMTLCVAFSLLGGLLGVLFVGLLVARSCGLRIIGR